MRRASFIVDGAEGSDGGFAELYRHYVQLCADEGIEPMPPKALLAILKALALGEELRERDATLH